MAYQVQPAITGSGIAGIGRAWTAELWDGCDPAAIQRDPSLGHFYQDQFINAPVFATAQAAGANYGNYNGFTNTTGNTIGFSAVQGGGVRLAGTTQNEMSALQFGTYGNRPFQFVSVAEDDTWTAYGADKTAQGYTHPARIRFETRFAVNTVVAGEQNIFIGFCELLQAALLDSGTTADVVNSKPFIGFHTLGPTANATLRFIIQNTATAPTVIIASVGTLVANTWYMVGMDWNPLASPSQRMSIWFNGARSGTYLTASDAATIANFPFSNDTTQYQLSPTWARTSGGAGDYCLTVSGFRVFQEPIVNQGNEACA